MSGPVAPHGHDGPDGLGASPATDDVASRDGLVARLELLGIVAPIVAYPKHTTIEEGKRLRGDLPGEFTKNLLLKYKKDRLFLVAAHEDNDVDLKTLHTRVGAQGRLRFASAEDMDAALGVRPGTLTPLAVINDHDGAVTVVIDRDLMAAQQVNFHPLVHTESIGLAPNDLRTFLEGCGHAPLIAALGQQIDNV